MALGYERERGYTSYLNGKMLNGNLDLSSDEYERYNRIRRYWDFYEGYHWENLPESEGVEHTINYCKAFVNKYVSFELGEGFTFSTKYNMQEVKVTKEGKNTFEYLESV